MRCLANEEQLPRIRNERLQKANTYIYLPNLITGEEGTEGGARWQSECVPHKPCKKLLFVFNPVMLNDFIHTDNLIDFDFFRENPVTWDQQDHKDLQWVEITSTNMWCMFV